MTDSYWGTDATIERTYYGFRFDYGTESVDIWERDPEMVLSAVIDFKDHGYDGFACNCYDFFGDLSGMAVNALHYILWLCKDRAWRDLMPQLELYKGEV